MAESKPNLYDLSVEEIETLLTGWGEPRYRARQVWVWLYKHLAAEVEEMSSLPKA
jgi:23S rRNA (adenine2503-C2)-methyltransferase